VRVSSWKSVSVAIVGILGITIFLSASPAPPALHSAQVAQSTSHQIVLSIDADQSKISWNVDTTLHEVHGTFRLKSGSLQIISDTGKASGEIIVAATSGDSGNTSRDARMHKEIIESAKYPEAIFRPAIFDGTLKSSGASDITLRGTLLLHGSEHPLSIPVHAEFTNDSWKGTGKFTVPYTQWGMKDASNFLLKVKPQVFVEVQLAGSLKSAD
jgi:polyisoprenoid-binding protein YceI